MDKEEKNEQKAIEYLRSQIDMDNSEAVLALYTQIIDQDVFHTRIGHAFLEELYAIIGADLAIDSKHIPAMPDIPEDTPKPRETPRPREVTKPTEAPKTTDEPKTTEAPKPKVGSKAPLRYSLFLNVVLLVMVVVMFILTITSDSPNIINYKNRITDEYAAWEEQLDEREKELDERERTIGEKETQLKQLQPAEDTGDADVTVEMNTAGNEGAQQ